MSTGTEELRRRMADFLAEKGVPCMDAWPEGAAERSEEPRVWVSLQGCQLSSTGFQDYLGERYDPEKGQWQEWFGKKAELTFGVDVYMAPEGETEKLRQVLDKLAGALTAGAPAGMAVQAFSAGALCYDENARLLKQQAQAVCLAYLQAAETAEGEFLDFELRGGVKQ